MSIDNILIAGAGALGSLYSHKLIEKGKNVFYLAEGERKERLEKNGIVVNGKNYQVKCAGDDNIFTADLVIVAVKYYHLDEIIPKIKNFIDSNTIIVSVLNGIDSEEIIRNNISAGKMMRSVPLGMDALREGNKITYTVEGKLHFYPFDTTANKKDAENLKELFDECLLACEVSENIMEVTWFKYMINTGVNQVSATLEADFGFMKKNKYAGELMESAMLEVIAIANAEGIFLDAKTSIEKWQKILLSLGDSGKTSMCQDIIAKRKTEVDAFAGRIMVLGEKHNIDVTVNRVLYNVLKAKEW